MATTTNYGWTTPDDTALVKDGASAIRTLGSSVDTTTKALNPSTTLGDIEYRSSTSNTNTRVGIGTSGQGLQVVAGVPSWAASSTSTLTTTGDTLYASAANTLARRAIGSTGDVLTVSGGLPTWAAPASGGMTLINTGGTTLTGSSVSISSIAGTYKNLQLVVRNFKPATDNSELRIRFNDDSDTNYGLTTSNDANDIGMAYTSVLATGGNDNTVANGLIITNIFDYANSVTKKYCITDFITNNTTTTGNMNMGTYKVYWGSLNAINKITLFATTGNLTSGTAFLYGVS
jgi:hypothetical protein